jgi:hypothetical protein
MEESDWEHSYQMLGFDDIGLRFDAHFEAEYSKKSKKN